MLNRKDVYVYLYLFKHADKNNIQPMEFQMSFSNFKKQIDNIETHSCALPQNSFLLADCYLIITIVQYKINGKYSKYLHCGRCK